MFDWLRKSGKVHEFAGVEEAFSFACLDLDPKPLIEAVVPALVLEKGHQGSDGGQCFRLRLAGKESCHEIWGCTLGGAGGAPEPGDMVGFRIVSIAEDVPGDMGIIGYIAVKLEPVYIEKRGWRIGQSYTPTNIKRAIRF